MASASYDQRPSISYVAPPTGSRPPSASQGQSVYDLLLVLSKEQNETEALVDNLNARMVLYLNPAPSPPPSTGLPKNLEPPSVMEMVETMIRAQRTINSRAHYLLAEFRG